jgi:hypothetical protein
MRSVQPLSDLRPTRVQPRPAYLVRLTLDRLDAWTSNPALGGLGVPSSDFMPTPYCRLPANCGLPANSSIARRAGRTALDDMGI